MRTSARFVDERGAGVVIALGLMTALVGLSLALFSASNRYLQQARLNALAENASIAAADALRGLVAGAPCDVARKVAVSGECRIVSCSIIGTDLLIKLERDGLVAKARAGAPESEQS